MRVVLCGVMGQCRQTKVRRQSLKLKYRSSEVAWGEVLEVEVEVEFEVEEQKAEEVRVVVEKRARQGEVYDKRGEE